MKLTGRLAALAAPAPTIYARGVTQEARACQRVQNAGPQLKPIALGRMPHHLLFVAGVPASGKTHFCSWLEREHGYLHIDAELNTQLDSLGLHETWDRCASAMDCRPFAAALQLLARPIAFNWGFPVACLAVAASLKRAGFDSWWFNADTNQAREAFRRDGKSIASFDKQVQAINLSWPSIRAVFEPHVIAALDPNGTRIDPDALWRHMGHAA